MAEILLYAFGIMYTPGPVNLLSLHAGLHGQARHYLGFCLGVALAMLLLFLAFGYAGAWMISERWQQPLAVAGSSYVLYLALKILYTTWKSSSHGSGFTEASAQPQRFHQGLLLQMLNPKAPVAILPIVTIQFPAAQISGPEIAVWSLLLSVMAFGAPGAYLLAGQVMGQKIRTRKFLRVLNTTMASLLIYTGLIMLVGAL